MNAKQSISIYFRDSDECISASVYETAGMMNNKLIEESSLYLLQHAHNPVAWYPWAEEALSKAKTENKLILLSIGYSACHWCHVMERETFENQQVAEIMNQHFVSIKIDREERPDIDQIYMHAIQLMIGSGGWPLNCICLPDQRPIYGGTYFKTADWINLLINLATFWNEKPQEAIQYATRLTAGIGQDEQISLTKNQKKYTAIDLRTIVDCWKSSFDGLEGGYQGAPKFPLPSHWRFMLRYTHLMKDELVDASTQKTLEKIAFGGIRDHIGGGFARYSVDDRWHIPHFEKMLYDNAQLVSLYAEAYQHKPNALYKQLVYETLGFVKRELTSPKMGFYAALNADSEGIEGKFYTFTKAELKTILDNEEAELFCSYYQVTELGNWRGEETNVLFRKESDAALSEKWAISVEELQKSIAHARAKVFAHRSKRIRPSLDTKILTSWNGMMLKAYTDAYRVFDEIAFLDVAIANAHFILDNLFVDGKLFHLYQPSSSIARPKIGAFLDDYAFLVEAFIALYQVTFNEYWLQYAKKMVDEVIIQFYDLTNGLFFYVSKYETQLIARKQEVIDQVIPSSNAVMAHNLLQLGYLFDHSDYLDIASKQLQQVYPYIKKDGFAYSNWASLLLNEVFGLLEIAIVGQEAEIKRKELEQCFIPNKILFGGNQGKLPLLQNKWGASTQVFVCKNKVCYPPYAEVHDAIKDFF